jgi:hypothetical protein
MQCPHIDSCEMFPIFSQKALLNVWKVNYCEADFTRCARYRLACAAEVVPLTLLPNGKHLTIVDPAGNGDG